MTVFDIESFDLGTYLDRIGHDGPVAADLPTLRSLAQRHPQAIPFENLNPLLRIPVPLDIDVLQQKLLRDGRGGWCFEQNTLLGTALTALGYRVTGLAARVMWTMPSGVVTPRSHMVLRIDLEGGPYIVDAGFGGLTLTGALRLEAGIEQETPHERFRLMPAGDNFVLEACIRGEWKALYRFDLQPQALADYEVTSWYLSTNPRSHFLTTLVAARVDRDRRYALRNNDFAIHHADGYTERRPITDPGELRDILEQQFDIRMPTGADVDAVLTRVASNATSPVTT
jgi:N-hydroxyarylamine O-acetyltransferase